MNKKIFNNQNKYIFFKHSDRYNKNNPILAYTMYIKKCVNFKLSVDMRNFYHQIKGSVRNESELRIN